MNQIQQLINQMCPNGVEYQPLWTLTAWDKHFNGVDKNMQKKVIPYKYYLSEEFNAVEKEDGDILYIATGVSDKKRFTTEDLASDYIAEGEIVCIPWGGTPNVKYYKGKFVTGDNRIATSLDTNVLNNKFLYYWMCNRIKDISLLYRGAGIKHPSMKGVLSLQIPVPPLAIQTRIVEILDHFTNLTAKLTAELNLRRKQFEHYREKLLSLDGVEGVEWKKLGEVVVSLKTGLNPRDNFVLNADGADCYYITGKEIRNNIIQVSDKTDLISKDVVKLINKRAQLHSNVLLFASTGTGTVGRMAIVEEYNEEWNVSETLYIITPKECILLRFMMYVLYSNVAVNQFTPKISKGSVPHLKVVDLLNTKIPIPPLATQHSIVSILDKFTALIENIEKELALRQKQYEYYREELLRFGG